jgi:hypothetical protein
MLAGIAGFMFCGLAAVPSTSEAALQEVFWNGSTFASDTPFSTQYNDLDYRGVGDNYMALPSSGGVAEVSFSGAWNVTSYPVGGTVFSAIAHKSGDAYNATVASGGFAEVFWNGSTYVKDTTVNSGTVYTDIVYRGVADAYMLTRASGGVTEITFSGGWNTFDYAVGGTVFSSIAHKTGDSYLATLASGGFAEVFWNGSTFQASATEDAGTIYTDVTYRGSGDLYMLTRADGGVTELSFSGGWNISDYPVGGTVYNAIAHKSGDSYLASIAVPEPASLSLLALTGLLAKRRK